MNRVFLVSVGSACHGALTGWVDESGRWVALVPAGEPRPAFLSHPDYACADEPGRAAAARAAFAAWESGGAAPAVAAPGTAFQRRVWAALRAIPVGETRTYAEIAAAVGCRSARAVGGAVAKNPVALLIPCHRVVPKSGGVGGFAWGAARKAAWLAAESPTSRLATTPRRRVLDA